MPSRFFGVANEDVKHARSLLLWRLVQTLIVFIVAASFVLIVLLLQRNADLSASIKDCIDPSGHCYKEGSDRAKLLGDVSAFAAACADLPGTQSADQIQACILRKLAEAEN